MNRDDGAMRVLDKSVWSNPFLSGLEEHAAIHLADQDDGNYFAYLEKSARPAPLLKPSPTRDTRASPAIFMTAPGIDSTTLTA